MNARNSQACAAYIKRFAGVTGSRYVGVTTIGLGLGLGAPRRHSDTQRHRYVSPGIG